MDPIDRNDNLTPRPNQSRGDEPEHTSSWEREKISQEQPAPASGGSYVSWMPVQSVPLPLALHRCSLTCMLMIGTRTPSTTRSSPVRRRTYKMSSQSSARKPTITTDPIVIVAMTVTETILEVAEIAMLPRICAESPLLATVGALMPRKTHGSERAPMAMVV